MPDRTQTVHIELERAEVEALLRRGDADGWKLGAAEEKLHNALSSSPEQGGEGERVERLAKAIELALPQLGDGPNMSAYGHFAEDCALVHMDHWAALASARGVLIDAFAEITGESSPDLHARLVPTRPCDCKSCIGEEAHAKAVADYLASCQPPAPALSDEERERLREVAMTLQSRGDYRDSAFLRDLASREQGKSGRIANLEALEPGWDSYGGEPPTEQALDRLRGFDRALSYVPLPDGGVQVEFHALGLDFEVVIDKDGAVREYDLEPSSPEHLERPEVPEEAYLAAYAAVRAVAKRRSHHAPMPDGPTTSAHSRAAVEAAAPAIRKQERQRALEALAAHFARRAVAEHDERGELWRVGDAYKQAAEYCRSQAALDSLEDENG